MSLTMDDFQLAITDWISQNVPEKYFNTLKNLYAGYLKAKSENDAQGVLNAITCFSEVKELQNFLNHSSNYASMSVIMRHCDGTTYPKIQKSFFYCISYYTSGKNKQLESLILNMISLENFPLASEQQAAALGNAIMDVNINLLFFEEAYPISTEMQTLISSRMTSLVGYLGSIAEQSYIKDNFKWLLSGSDPHNGGQQTLILKSTKWMHPDWVLKPRCMLAEQLLTSPVSPSSTLNSVFKTINSLLDGDSLKLPLLNVDYQAGSSYGTEPFIKKKETYTAAQATDYFTQMGMLLYVCTLFGCTDLHQDNIMPTSDGPVILDGECCFLLSAMKNPSLNSSLLINAINDPYNPFYEPAVSTFKISESYSIDYAQNALWAGFQRMRQTCEPVTNQLEDLFVEILKLNPILRILPLGTDTLKSAVAHSAREMQTAIRMITDTLNMAETKEEFGIELPSPEQSGVEAELDKGLRKGDIPLFQIRPDINASGEFLINGTVVGTCTAYTEVNVRNTFERVASFLCLQTKEDMPKIERLPFPSNL